jgi:hypothetical protein
VLARPTYRCPITVLPCSSLSLPHPTADTGPSSHPGPTCQPRPHRVDRAPPLSPVARQRRCPRLMARGRCWSPMLPTTTPGPHLILLLPLPCSHAHRGPSFFPSLPRATEAPEKPSAATHSLFSLFSSRPCLSLSSSPPFSTTYVSTSSAPTTGDPSSAPVPVRAPPPLSLHGETLPSTTIVPN